MTKKDSSNILVGCENGKIYRYSENEVKSEYSHHGEIVLNIVLVDEKKFVSNSTDLSIILWDYNNCTVIRNFDCVKDIATLIHYEPENQMLVITSLDGRIRGLDINGEEDGRAKHEIRTHSIIHSLVIGKQKLNIKRFKNQSELGEDVKESLKDEDILEEDPRIEIKSNNIQNDDQDDATPLIVEDADSMNKVQQKALELPEQSELRPDTANLAEQPLEKDAKQSQEETKVSSKQTKSKVEKEVRIKEDYDEKREKTKSKKSERSDKKKKKQESVQETEEDEDEDDEYEEEEEESEEGEESEVTSTQKEGGEGDQETVQEPPADPIQNAEVEEQKSPSNPKSNEPSEEAKEHIVNVSMSKRQSNLSQKSGKSKRSSKAKINKNIELSQQDTSRKKIKINGLFEMNKELLYDPESEELISEGYCYIVATINQNKNNSICLWDLISCSKVSEIQTDHTDEITTFIRSKDGCLLTGAKDGDINIYDPIL